MKRKLISYIARAVTLSLVFGFGGWALWYAYRIYKYEETNNAQVEVYISPISSRVMGYVESIECRENDRIEQGDTLLIIEDAEFRLACLKNEALLKRAEAELEIARKQIESNLIEQQQTESEIAISKIKMENARKEFRRVENLLSKESVTRQQYDRTEADYLKAQKEVDIAVFGHKKSLLRHEELIGNAAVAEAKVMDCKAQLERSRLDLEYTVIRAPYTGRIGKIDIQKGQLLQQGQVLTFITNESAGKWIVANLKETQLASYTVGREVTVTIDAFPDREFKGVVESVSPATGTRYSLLPPNNATGNFVRLTQRVPVRIRLLDIEQVEEQLRGGMSAYVLIEK